LYAHMVLCMCVRVHNQPGLFLYRSGLFSSFFWEQGFDKVRESSRTLELFEGFDVQF